MMMQIVAGHEEGIEKVFSKKKQERERIAVDREFMDNSIISEVLWSLILFAITAMEAAWGFGSITSNASQGRRLQTACIYFVVFTIECLGLVFSHRSVKKHRFSRVCSLLFVVFQHRRVEE